MWLQLILTRISQAGEMWNCKMAGFHKPNAYTEVLNLEDSGY